MATVVTIDGDTMSVPRDVILLQTTIFRRGSVPSATFASRGRAIVKPDPFLGKSATITIDGTLVFAGRIESLNVNYAAGVGWLRTYQAIGLRDRGDEFPHRDSNDASDVSLFNASLDNESDAFLLSRSGMTIGEIFQAVLEMPTNAANLDSVGIGDYVGLSPVTLPTATLTDLAAMTVVPATSVRVGGEKLLSSMEATLRQHAPNHMMWIDPGNNGRIRFLDQRGFTPITLTLNSDPINPPTFTVDLTSCFTRVVVEGAKIAEMFELTLLNGSLDESLFAHNGLTSAQAKTAFILPNFFKPGLASGQATASTTISGGAVTGFVVNDQGYGYASAPPVVVTGGGGSGATGTAVLTSGKVTSITLGSGGSGYTTAPSVVLGAPTGSSADTGTCTCPSTTTVTVTSSSAATVWPEDYWDHSSTGRKGTIFLSRGVTSNTNAHATREVTSNTAKMAGGTSTLTLDRALDVTTYNKYSITGNTGDAANVYTLYQITNNDIIAALAKQSTNPFPLRFSGGQGLEMISTPMGVVEFSSDDEPPYNEVITGVVLDRDAGTVRFGFPTFATAGREPHDVRAYVPVYTGVNQAIQPADSGGPVYAGTASTVYGLDRTLYVKASAWRDPIQAGGMIGYAADILDSVKDAVIEGSVEYLGLLSSVFAPGKSVVIEGSGYGLLTDDVEIPIVGVDVAWSVNGLDHKTTIQFSNRRAHYAAEQFLKPERQALDFSGGGSNDVFAVPSADLSGAAGVFAPTGNAPIAPPPVANPATNGVRFFT